MEQGRGVGRPSETISKELARLVVIAVTPYGQKGTITKRKVEMALYFIYVDLCQVLGIEYYYSEQIIAMEFVDSGAPPVKVHVSLHQRTPWLLPSLYRHKFFLRSRFLSFALSSHHNQPQ